MKISVNKYALEPKTVDGGTAGSHGLEELSFDFSSEWNGLYRTVTFFPPKSVAKCVSFTGDTVPLPPEVTARAGRIPYVLCGARDGAAIITLSGVIEVAQSLLPTDAEAGEHTPGALEQATLLCAEARADAQSAASSAQSALSAEAGVTALAAEVQDMRNAVSDLYDDVMDGTAVHKSITQANSADGTHAPSVAGTLEHLEKLMSVVSPFRIRIVDTQPDEPATDCIYLHEGNFMACDSYTYTGYVYKWYPIYSEGGGYEYLYTVDPQIEVGTVLYRLSADSLEGMESLEEVGYVSRITTEGSVTSFGTFAPEFIEECTLTGITEYNWHGLTADDDLTPYLRDNPASWLITGGAV